MTQDQYGQARDSGYVSGQVVEDDETGEFQDGQEKQMTRFQKVASALRGDKPGQDPQDTVPDDMGPDDMDPDNMGPDDTVPDTMAQDTSAAAADPNGAALGGTAAAGAGGQRSDYWDTQDVHGTGQDPVVAVTSPDVPVTDAGADPLAGQAAAADLDNADVPDHARTQPDMFRADADAADIDAGNAAAGTSGLGADDVRANDLGNGDLGNGDLGHGDLGHGDLGRGDVGNTPAPYADYQQQGGEATMPDVPVTPAPDSAAVTEAPNGPGRHAGAPAQELRPGEATGTLDDLGDLAYGKLIPDAADFTEQWQQIQFKFVDDPHASVTEAAEVVAQVTAKMEAAIQERQRAIEERQRAIQEQQRSLNGRWGDGSEADTETLRETLRMYRAFLDQLIGPKV